MGFSLGGQVLFLTQLSFYGNLSHPKESHMRANVIAAAAFFCGSLCVAQASDARPPAASPAWTGTWRLDLSRSKFSASEPRAETRTIALSGDRMMVRSDVTGPSGKQTHFHYYVTLDGRFHPLIGNPDGDSIAMRLVTANKVRISVRRNGKTSATATTEVSEKQLVMDRRRLKLSGTPSEDILVYVRVR